MNTTTQYTTNEMNAAIFNGLSYAVVNHVAKRIATASVNGTPDEQREAANDYKQHVGSMTVDEKTVFDKLIVDYTWGLTA